MTIEEVKQLMKSSKTAEDWNRNCNKVKAACGGYPDFWYVEVIASGLADSVMAKFGRDTGIRITSIKSEEQ